MIDDSVLDEILPIPDADELLEETAQELADEGFAITNFNSGGIFHTLLMIIFQVRIELVKLLRSVLNNMFVTHATRTWLDLVAANYSKKRKTAKKTQGVVTVSREITGEAITVPKGHVFKTKKDINGTELRFFVLADTILQQDVLSVEVPVEAEKTGTSYNVAVGQITRTLTNLDGIDSINNDTGRITQEGSDTEDDDSLRERTLNSWADVATMPIAQKYKNACEAVSGVLFVRVNDQHPRGQGTIDIIVTSTAGEATQTLLDEVLAAAEKIQGPYDDLQVISSTTQTVDVAVTASVKMGTNTDGLGDRIEAAILSVMKISKDRNLNELLHSDLIYAIRNGFSAVTNAKVTAPEDDLTLDTDIVILPGTVTVTITEV